MHFGRLRFPSHEPVIRQSVKPKRTFNNNRFWQISFVYVFNNLSVGSDALEGLKYF